MNRLMAGLLAGAAATVPMTVLMRWAHALLSEDERYPLPPERIATRLADDAGFDAHPERPGWEWKTHLMHFGFGSAAGAAYAACEQKIPLPPAAKGSVFGLSVWAVAYLAGLPSAGLHPPATHEPAGRNLLMIASHLVWGACAGLATEQLVRPRVVTRRLS
jgi:hypothetical protein